MKIIRRNIKKLLSAYGIVITRKNDNYDWIINRNINTVVDIGANSGQYINKLSHYLPKSTKWVAFEPIPEVYQQLIKNTKHLNIEYHNIGLGNQKSEIDINLNEHSPSSSFLDMANTHKENYSFAKKVKKEKVNIDFLDNVMSLDKIQNNILVKIDVQGYEDMVIDGGSVFLKQAEIILIEMSFQILFEGQMLFHDIYEKLRLLGFEFAGNFEQAISQKDGGILYANSIFLKKKTNK